MTEDLDHEMICARAYELWQAAGQPDGRDLEFWTSAAAEARAGVTEDTAPASTSTEIKIDKAEGAAGGRLPH